MATGWRYGLVSAGMTVAGTVAAVLTANHPAVQRLFSLLPVVGTLPAVTLSGTGLALAVATTAVVVVLSFAPLHETRPRRPLDTAVIAAERVLLATILLAAVGYFDYTYRLPRSTLVVVTGILLVALPPAFVAIGRRPQPTGGRAVVVGDSPERIAAPVRATGRHVIGYVSTGGRRLDGDGATDGGVTTATTESEVVWDLDMLGGLPRLEEVVLANDVDTVLLAFDESDRAAFFGTLDVCHRYGVTALVHRDHADRVLMASYGEGDLVGVDLEPWGWHDRVLKRAFDVAFASAALVALAPVMAVIAAAIKLDDGGSILYSQDRTAAFGDRFTIHKFRTMTEDAEAGTGAVLSAEDAGGVDPRVTDIGRILRPTHLDEIPQLWAVLRGDMSVVGPRPERPELDAEIGRAETEWPRRWFVKPGLTGLSQVNEATGHEPDEKLRYDIEYIRRQSFWFDLKIVLRQLYLVGVDAAALARRYRQFS